MDQLRQNARCLAFIAALLCIGTTELSSSPRESGVKLVVQKAQRSVEDLAYHPGGRYLVSVSVDRSLQVWDLRHRMLLRTHWFPAPIHRVAFSPSGRRLVIRQRFGKALLLSFPAMRVQHTFKTPTATSALAFSPDRKYLAGLFGSTVIIWRLKDRKEIFRRQWKRSNCLSPVLRFSPRRNLLAVGRGTDIQLMTTAGREVRRFKGVPCADCCFVSADFSHDGKRFAAATNYRHENYPIEIFDVASGEGLLSIRSQFPSGKRIFFGRRSRNIISWGTNSLQVYNSYSARPVFKTKLDVTFGTPGAISPDRRTVAVAGQGEFLGLMNVEKKTRTKRLGNDLALVQDHIAVAPWGFLRKGHPHVFMLRPFDAQPLLKLPMAGVNSRIVLFPTANKFVVTAENEVRLYAGRTGTLIKRQHTGIRVPPRFSVIGPNVIAARSSDKGIIFQDLSLGGPPKTYKISDSKAIVALAYKRGPSGEYLYASFIHPTRGPLLKIFRLPSGKLIKTIRPGPGASTYLAPSPDGRLLASSGLLGVTFYQVPDGRPIGSRLRPAIHPYSAIAFNPSGSLLAMPAVEKGKLAHHVINLREVPSGRVIRTLRGMARPSAGFIFGSQGKLLFSIGTDNSIRIWNVADGRLSGSVLFFEDGAVLVHTPAGTFELFGAKNPRKYIAFRKGNRFVNFNRNKRRYSRPGLLRDILKRKK